jgi:hypothetical protein
LWILIPESDMLDPESHCIKTNEKYWNTIEYDTKLF